MNTSINTSSKRTKSTYEYTEASIWSNIKYLLIMLAIIVIPPQIPGVTTQGLVTSYAGVVIAIYIMAFVFKLALELRQKKSAHSRRR